MTLELIIFIGAIIFGMFIYWRESQSNNLYRFFNKIMNSKKLQMKEADKKGFIYQQSFFVRLLFISTFFLIFIVCFLFIIPINIANISLFASMIFGTLLGTYFSGFIFKSSKIIEEKTETLEEIVHETIEKGKDFISDISENKKEEEVSKELEEPTPKKEEKSARERLKDKGLL